MAHVPGAKAGSLYCCLPVGLSEGFAGIGFSPKTSPAWSLSSAAWSMEGKSSLVFSSTGTHVLH